MTTHTSRTRCWRPILVLLVSLAVAACGEPANSPAATATPGVSSTQPAAASTQPVTAPTQVTAAPPGAPQGAATDPAVAATNPGQATRSSGGGDAGSDTEVKTGRIGQPVDVGNVTVTVTGVRDVAANQILKPDEGNKFFAVDVTFKNNGSSEATVSTVLQMGLKDSAGNEYGISIPASAAANGAEGSTPDGNVPPRGERTGTVGFHIPQDATGLIFFFNGVELLGQDGRERAEIKLD